MSSKAEIGWKSSTPEGERREVYARHFGHRWLFFTRVRRYDQWQPLPDPPLADWLALLDAVERRVERRLVPPDEPARIRKRIRELFPETSI